MAKLNWDRQPNETYDASLDVEWRRGPIDVSFEFPDGEATVDLKLNAVPDIYWAKALGKAFRDDSEEGHVKLFDAASRAAASVYYRGGWNLGRLRMLSLYQRASGLVPYPSLYFAVYFDCCLLNVVKYDHKQRGAALPPSFPAYDNSIYSRTLGRNRKLATALGMQGLYERLRDIRRKVIESRG